MKKATLLIVEDDLNILRANTAALELEGYRVLAAETLESARSAAKACPPDLILLDILLPDGNGLDFCGELRGESGVRILFLSALGEKADVLAGLRAGGDDYIAKPYDMDELILRVEALLRRGRMIGRARTAADAGKPDTGPHLPARVSGRTGHPAQAKGIRGPRHSCGKPRPGRARERTV